MPNCTLTPSTSFSFRAFVPDEETLRSLEVKLSITDGLKHIRVTRDVDIEDLKCLKIHKYSLNFQLFQEQKSNQTSL